MNNVTPFHPESASRGTSHRPHRTLSERRERYTLAQRLMEENTITYDSVASLAGETLATTHRALDPMHFRRMRWESLCRIRFAVCLLLARIGKLPEQAMWDEYDDMCLTVIKNTPDPAA